MRRSMVAHGLLRPLRDATASERPSIPQEVSELKSTVAALQAQLASQAKDQDAIHTAVSVAADVVELRAAVTSMGYQLASAHAAIEHWSEGRPHLSPQRPISQVH